jgi:hypothetical protein
VFTEVFLVQTRRKLQKIHFEVRIEGKIKFGKRVPNFKTKSKKGNSRGGGREFSKNSVVTLTNSDHRLCVLIFN